MLQHPTVLNHLPDRANDIIARCLHSGREVPDNKELAIDLLTALAVLDVSRPLQDVLVLAATRLLENQVVLTPPTTSKEEDCRLLHSEVSSTHQVKHFFEVIGGPPRVIEITADQFGNRVREKALGLKSSEAWLEEFKGSSRRSM